MGGLETWVVFVCGAVVTIMLLGLVVIPAFQRRCPRCGKFWATITRSDKVADVSSTEFQYDERTGTDREVTIRNEGFMVGYSCRGCDNSWERLRSRSAKVPLTSSEESEHAVWKGPRTEEERRRDP